MIWLKRISLVLIALVLLLGAGIQLAPWFAINWLEDYYAKQGETHRLDIGDWSLNLIKGQLSLTNIDASWSKDQQAQIKQIALDLQWMPLFNQTIHIESIVFEGSNSPIRQDDQHIFIAGLKLPQSQLQANKKPVDNKNEIKATETAASEWSIQIDHIDIIDHQYDIALNTLSTLVKIERLRLNNLNSKQDGDTDIALQAEIAELTLPDIQQADSAIAIELSGALSKILKSPTFLGDLTVNNIQFVNPILSLDSITVQGINVEESKLTSDEFKIKGLELGKQEDEQFWVTLDEYWLNKLTLTSFGFTTGIHYLSGLKLNNYRNEQGALDYSIASNTQTVAEQENSTSKMEATKEPENGKAAVDAQQNDSDFFINIEGITLQDKEGSLSTIWFRDQSIDPNYVVPMALKAFSISALSMKDLDAPFEPDVNIQLIASVDNYSEINFNAQLNRQAGWPVGKAKLELEQFNIIPLNGYMINAIGYRAQKGMLNVNTEVSLNDENLSGETTIFLRNSKLEPKDKDTISRVSKQISMPVDTALDLLRDDNGNLQLSIPMSGKISDPDFAYDDVMNQLGTLALKTASMHYLQQSLQPYGALISLLSFAADSIMAIRLNQLDFEENQSALNQKHKDYLDKVSKILAEKTDLELQVCPYVSKQESEQENWPKLGQDRAEAIKAYLAQYQDQDKQSLAKRTTICVTEVADSPHVDLGV